MFNPQTIKKNTYAHEQCSRFIHAQGMSDLNKKRHRNQYGFIHKCFNFPSETISVNITSRKKILISPLSKAHNYHQNCHHKQKAIFRDSLLLRSSSKAPFTDKLLQFPKKYPARKPSCHSGANRLMNARGQRRWPTQLLQMEAKITDEIICF